jgi:hypothetical protein
MAAHALGMVGTAASIRKDYRQFSVLADHLEVPGAP